jgi:hypothetical protein
MCCNVYLLLLLLLLLLSDTGVLDDFPLSAL